MEVLWGAAFGEKPDRKKYRRWYWAKWGLSKLTRKGQSVGKG